MCSKYSFIFFLIFIISCKETNHFQEKKFGRYSVELPNDWQKSKLKGIDTEQYLIYSGLDSILIERGINISEFSNLQNSIESFDTINSCILQKVKPKYKLTKGKWGIYIGGNYFKDKFRLVISLNDTTNLSLISKVLTSIKIDDKSIVILNKEVIGEIIYNRDCFICHGPIKEGFMGISLVSLMKKRDNIWMQNWLQSETFRKNNITGSYNQIEGLRNVNCSIKILNSNERYSLVTYLKSF
jgi:hypothetical protein